MADERKHRAGRDSWEPGIRHAFRKAGILGKSPSPVDPPPASRYEIHDELARDRASVLLRARDREVDRDVTLRVLGDELNGDETSVRRFLEEAQVGAQLQHPGILPVYGLGLLEDGRAYVASRIVEGETLAQLLTGGTSPERLLSILEQAAHAAAYAHARGVAHGALDASRIHVGPHGEVVISGWERAVRASWDTHRIEADVNSLLDLLGEVLGKSVRGKLDSAGAVARTIGKHLAGREARVREAEISAATARVAAERERARALQTERLARKARSARRRTLGLAAAALLLLSLCYGGYAWRRGEEASERARVDAQCAVALREARRHETAGDWAKARAFAMKAAALAPRDDIEAAALLARVEREARLATQDAALAVRLEEIRADSLWTDREETVANYEAAFREHGLDLLGMGREEAVAALRSRTDSAALAAAVYTWARCFERITEDEPLRLVEIARLADPHPWRSAFRACSSHEELHRLAVTADLAALLPRTLEALSCMLDACGQPEAALRVVREARLRYPGDLSVVGEEEHLFKQLAGPRERSVSVQIALARHPRDKRLWVNLGALLLMAGDPEAAMGSDRRALELDDGDAAGHMNLSWDLAALGRIADAVERARRAVELAPDEWRTHYNLGAHLCNYDVDLAEAAAEFREAIRLRPDVAYTHLCLGHALDKTGDREGAFAAFERASRIAPDSQPGLRAESEVLRIRGDLEASLRTRLRALDAPHQLSDWSEVEAYPQILSEIEGICASLGQPEVYAAVLREQILKTPPEHPRLGDLYCWLSATLALNGRLEEALATSRAAVGLRPGSALVQCSRGCVLEAAGRILEARLAYEKACALDPRLQAAHYNLGILFQQVGDPSAAIPWLEKAAALSPSWDGGLPGLEGFELPDRETGEALLNRKRFHTHSALSQAYAAVGRSGEALTQLRAARGLYPPGEFAILNSIAWILATDPDPRIRDPEGAVRAAEAAQRLEPGSGRIRNTLGISYYRAGRYGDAVRELLASQRLLGDRYLAHDGLFLAMAYAKLGRRDKAVQWYELSDRWMKERSSIDAELDRFRAEASELLGVSTK